MFQVAPFIGLKETKVPAIFNLPGLWVITDLTSKFDHEQGTLRYKTTQIPPLNKKFLVAVYLSHDKNIMTENPGLSEKIQHQEESQLVRKFNLRVARAKKFFRGCPKRC